MPNEGFRVLVVEDEPLQREMVTGHLESRGYRVSAAGSGEQALESLRKWRADVVLADYRLPRMTGLELLESVRRLHPGLPFMMMTAFATVEVAVRAMRMGAVDFLTKPVELAALDALMERVLEGRRLAAENERLRRRLAQLGSDRFVPGRSEGFLRLLELARRVAPTSSTVLITGETGCGKEMIADLLQSESTRRSAPFVKVNCGAIPNELFESELFGHRRGSFTGADRDRAGRLAEADGGTLMLDEIAELPAHAQVKLLRVLENGQYFPVGSDEVRKADVRLIACTNRDLQSLVAAGQFREDLFFRLSVVPLHVPPLRERREDIGPLLDYFLETLASRLKGGPRGFSPQAREALSRYDWPGNVRQLRNVVERLTILSAGPVIDTADLPPEVTASAAPAPSAAPPDGAPVSLDTPISLPGFVEQLEQDWIRRALEAARGNQTRASELLGLSERVLRYKLQKYGIVRGPHR